MLYLEIMVWYRSVLHDDQSRECLAPQKKMAEYQSVPQLMYRERIQGLWCVICLVRILKESNQYDGLIDAKEPLHRSVCEDNYCAEVIAYLREIRGHHHQDYDEKPELYDGGAGGEYRDHEQK
jgi:hypothetical protein